MEKKLTFSEYLFYKYIEWEKAQKEPKTTADFAEAVGVNRQTINKLLEKGSDNIPQLRTVHALAKVVGDDIYEFLGLTQSKLDFELVKQNWEQLPADARGKIVEIVKASVVN